MLDIIIIIIIIFYFHLKNQTRYSAITYRVVEMVGCQKSKCSSSWPPITTFTCIVNIQNNFVFQVSQYFGLVVIRRNSIIMQWTMLGMEWLHRSIREWYNWPTDLFTSEITRHRCWIHLLQNTHKKHFGDKEGKVLSRNSVLNSSSGVLPLVVHNAWCGHALELNQAVRNAAGWLIKGQHYRVAQTYSSGGQTVGTEWA